MEQSVMVFIISNHDQYAVGAHPKKGCGSLDYNNSGYQVDLSDHDRHMHAYSLTCTAITMSDNKHARACIRDEPVLLFLTYFSFWQFFFPTYICLIYFTV